MLDHLERLGFSGARVRFVSGDEPWFRAHWYRALSHVGMNPETRLSVVEIERRSMIHLVFQ
jgi:hypothetical protein